MRAKILIIPMLQFHTPPPAGVAPGAPAAVVARGADPSVDVPAAPAHFFRRIANLPLQAPPGALFPVASLVPLSLVESIGGAALNTGADVGVRQSNFLLRGVFPEKFDAVISQLEAEPPGVGLDPAASYESPSHAAAAVRAAASRVAQRVRDGFPLHPAYVLNQQDLYDHEPMAANALAGLVALSQPPNGLCFSHLEGDGNFLVHYGTLAFSCYGRCLAASRDSPVAPSRRFLSDVRALADSAGFSSVVGTLVSPGSLQGWLGATLAPSFISFLDMVGAGADSREQAVRDQHFLRYGTDDQKQLVVAALACKAPLRPRLPNILAVTGSALPPGVMASHLGRLCRAAALASLRSIADVSSLFTLDGALKEAVRSLTAPGLVITTVEDKIARIEEFFGSNPSRASASGGASAASRSAYSNDLSILISQAPWRATEAALLAELGAQRRPLFLFETLMTSSVLGARQLALGTVTVGDELKRLLSLSQPLSRTIDLLNNGDKPAASYVRHKLIADAFVASRAPPAFPPGAPASLEPVTEAEIGFHTKMPREMSSALLRGAFDEVDWVQLLRLLVSVARPNNVVAAYSDAWYNPHFVPLITPHLERLSALLGLPSALAPGSLPVPIPPSFGTLSSIAHTIAREYAEIVGVPNAFQQENLEKLTRFSTEAFPEAARRFHASYSCADPAGPLPGSLFDQPSASLSLLSTLQKAVAEQEKMATNQEALYKLTARVAEFGSLEALVTHLVGTRRPSSPGPSVDPKKPKALTNALANDKGRKGDRDKGKGRDDDRSRSPSLGRDSRGSSPARSDGASSPAPGAIGARKDAVHQSADGKTFWYQDPATGKRASPVYVYDVLETLAGKTRHELDFAVILSSKSSAQARATLCRFEGQPGHEHAGSSAHLSPYADFVAKVHSHFQEPTSSRAPTSARTRP